MDRYLFGSVSRSEIEILEMEIRKSGENRPLDIASEGRPQDVERLTPPTMTEDNEILESGAKIAKLATTLAGTSIMALAVAFFGSQNAIPYHKYFLLALLISMCISFTNGVLMLILRALCHSSPNMTAVVKILMLGSIVWAALGVLSGIAFCIQRMF